MHHVHCDCLAPQYWEYYPNIRLHYIGHPVTVVTSRELRNQNQAVSETETWQLYGALMGSCSHQAYPRFMKFSVAPESSRAVASALLAIDWM